MAEAKLKKPYNFWCKEKGCGRIRNGASLYCSVCQYERMKETQRERWRRRDEENENKEAKNEAKRERKSRNLRYLWATNKK